MAVIQDFPEKALIVTFYRYNSLMIENATIEKLINAGSYAHQQGWVPATSGNFSALTDDNKVCITVSGTHKGRLSHEGFMQLDLSGSSQDPVDHKTRKPSAESLLHLQLYKRFENVKAVLHVHSPNATIISNMYDGWITLNGYELLKAFSGIDSHESKLVVPVFANNQDMQILARQVNDYLVDNSPVYGYLIKGHGLYVWGESVDETVNYLEAFDFLFACELRMKGMGG